MSSFIRSDLNLCIKKGIFPSNLKNADITPLFKKLDHLLKSNYRPVSILPTLLKIYEKLLYQQMYEYFDSIFSKYLSGFRNNLLVTKYKFSNDTLLMISHLILRGKVSFQNIPNPPFLLPIVVR